MHCSYLTARCQSPLCFTVSLLAACVHRTYCKCFWADLESVGVKTWAGCLSEENEVWQKQNSVQCKEEEEQYGAKRRLNNEYEAKTTGSKMNNPQNSWIMDSPYKTDIHQCSWEASVRGKYLCLCFKSNWISMPSYWEVMKTTWHLSQHASSGLSSFPVSRLCLLQVKGLKTPEVNSKLLFKGYSLIFSSPENNQKLCQFFRHRSMGVWETLNYLFILLKHDLQLNLKHNCSTLCAITWSKFTVNNNITKKKQQKKNTLQLFFGLNVQTTGGLWLWLLID